jgi:hypothetical protein
MRRLAVFVVVAFSLVGIAANANANLRIGGGIHYLKTLGDLKDTPEFDEHAIGFLGAIKYASGLFTLEGDLEVIPDYSGSGEIMFQPQAYALIGKLIYGGVGAGVGYLGEFGWQDPFYALRAGVDFIYGPVDLDIFASYRFQEAKDLSTATTDDLDSITFGALIYFSLGSD